MKHKILTVMYAIVPLIFSSCASHTAIEANTSDIQTHIQPGDKVRVVTKDNEESEFEVVEVTDEAIVGENVKILFADIAQLEEVKTSNLVQVAFITVLLAVVVGALLVSSAGDNYFGLDGERK